MHTAWAKFEALEQLFLVLQNFRNYRQALAAIEPGRPCIPYIPLHLRFACVCVFVCPLKLMIVIVRDILMITERESDKRDALINSVKALTLGRQLDQLLGTAHLPLVGVASNKAVHSALVAVKFLTPEMLETLSDRWVAQEKGTLPPMVLPVPGVVLVMLRWRGER